MSDWFEDGAAGAALDVPGMFTPSVLDAYLDVVRAGALVSVGLTSDGGALGVTVTSDGRWKREYFRDEDALSTWLLGAATYLTSGAPRSATSGNGGGAPKRQRRPRSSSA